MLVGATTENPYFEVNSALISRTQVYELQELTPEDIARAAAAGAGRGRARRVSDEVIEFLAARSGGRRALVAERARAGAGHRGAHRRGGDAGRRRGRDAAQGPALRQGRRPALRLHLGLDQVHARVGPGRVAVLPGGDARGRRGRPLHRAPDGDPGVRGHRQRGPAGAAGRGRRGPRGRARRAARGTYALAQCAIYLALAPKSNAAGTRARRRPRATSRRRARRPRRRRCARRPTRRRASSAAASATTTRTTIPGRSTTRSTCPRRASTCASTSPATWSRELRERLARIRAGPRPRRDASTLRAGRSRCGRSCRSPRGRATSGARRWRCSTSSTTSRCGWRSETGWPRAHVVLSELLPAAAACTRWPTTGPRALADRRVIPRAAWLAGRSTRLVRSPVGVVGVRGPSASPWREPVLETAAALLAGNAVICSARRWRQRPARDVPARGRAGRAADGRARGADLDARCRRVIDLPRPNRLGTLLVLEGAPREQVVEAALWAAFGGHAAAAAAARHVAGAVPGPGRGARAGAPRALADRRSAPTAEVVVVEPGRSALPRPPTGPMLAVVEVADADTAVALAAREGRGGPISVWARDRAKGERVARRLPSPTTWVGQLRRARDRTSRRGSPATSSPRQLEWRAPWAPGTFRATPRRRDGAGRAPSRAGVAPLASAAGSGRAPIGAKR